MELLLSSHWAAVMIPFVSSRHIHIDLHWGYGLSYTCAFGEERRDPEEGSSLADGFSLRSSSRLKTFSSYLAGGENGSPPITQTIHFSEKSAPDQCYLIRVALRLMGVAASALDTGQFSLASFANFWKVSTSMPGTTASVSRSIGLMAKPPGT